MHMMRWSHDTFAPVTVLGSMKQCNFSKLRRNSVLDNGFDLQLENGLDIDNSKQYQAK